MDGRGGNDPNWAVEIASLKKDVEVLSSELAHLRQHVDRQFHKREVAVDRDFVDLKVYIKDEFGKIAGRFNEFTPLVSFKPLVWWFRAIGLAVLTAMLSASVALFTWVINALTGHGGGPGGG